MSESDILRGTVVHVHPHVVCLLSKQNHIGVISEANIALDDYYVEFEDRFTGLYSANALTTLLSPGQILKNVSSNAHEKIISFLQSDDVWNKIELMRYIREKPDLYKLCMIPLQSYLKLANDKNRTFCY